MSDSSHDPDTPVAFRPPTPRAIIIEGPAGALEARVDDPVPAGEPRGAVGVVCHPHPLHAGTMQNKVVHTAARALQEAGAATVRFNFRGVGASTGRYDEGVGEVADALAVIAWARREFACDALWLAGFSFGAAVALQAAAQAQPQRLVTIAPPVGRLVGDLTARPACPWLVVIGNRDELVAIDAVRAWVRSFEKPPLLLEVPHATHFFHGKLTELRADILRFVRGEDAVAVAT